MVNPIPEDLDALLDRGNTLLAEGDAEAAVAVFDKAVALCRVLVEETILPGVALVRAIGRHAMALSASGESAEAVKVAREGSELTGQLYGRESDFTTVDMVLVEVNFARLLAADGQGDEALRYAYYALQNLNDLTPTDPARYLAWRAALLRDVAEVSPEADEPDLAEVDVRRDLVETCRALLDLHPEDADARGELADALLLLARTADGDVAQAREAVTLRLADPHGTDGANALARALALLAELLGDEGRDDEADELITEAATHLDEPWRSGLPVLVLVWQWVSAPTFRAEQDVVEYHDVLLEPASDGMVDAALEELAQSEANRLRALRAASREVGVAEAYARRAADPLGFLVTFA